MTQMNIDQWQNTIKLMAGVTCAILAVYHIYKEPRRLLNGILLVLCIYFMLSGGLPLLMPDHYLSGGQVELGRGSEILFGFFLLFLAVNFFGGIALSINGIKVIWKEGRSVAHFLPVIFGLGIMTWPLLLVLGVVFVPIRTAFFFVWLIQAALYLVMYLWGMFLAFGLYSVVYALLPKKKSSDFILVHGAGLRKDGTVTPLLAGRLKKAIAVYKKGGEKACFIVSGGQGKDEPVAEGEAMKTYLQRAGIMPQQIIVEGKSTNTYENMKFSKAIMEKRKPDYTCLFVTSDYHVLRTAIIAKTVGLRAQGVGSRTALYYLPAAFIREYIAMIFKYKMLALVYLLWLIGYHVIFGMLARV